MVGVSGELFCATLCIFKRLRKIPIFNTKEKLDYPKPWVAYYHHGHIQTDFSGGLVFHSRWVGLSKQIVKLQWYWFHKILAVHFVEPCGDLYYTWFDAIR